MSTIHMPKVRNPFHPSEFLEEEFLQPKGLSKSELAQSLSTMDGLLRCLSDFVFE